MRVASIDLGSNSFHMLVVEVLGPTSFETVLAEKKMIQLGKKALVSGRLDPETMERGLQCLDEFRRMALARRVERTIAVATSAIRESENGDEFLHLAGARSGMSVRVISGREEARLVHLAVSRHIDLNSINPVDQIFTELVFISQLAQSYVGSTDQPDIHVDSLVGAQAGYLAVL